MKGGLPYIKQLFFVIFIDNGMESFVRSPRSTWPSFYLNQINQLHAVYRSQQGRQRELYVKTLRSPLSAEFWKHCVLSGRTQRHALARHQREEIEI